MIRSKGPIGHLKLSGKNELIHIFGAGITGLLMGYFLKRKGFQVQIYERSSELGGKIQTHQNEFGLTETAANAILSSPELIELLEELKLSYIFAKPGLKRLLFRQDQVRSFPFKGLEFITILLKLLKKLPKQQDISVHDFFSPLLGASATREVLGAAFNGIYATPVEELHFKSIFKDEIKSKTYLGFFLELKRKRKSHKARSLSFKNGMQELIRTLSIKLKDNIQMNSTKELDPYESNIICTDATDASELLEKHFPRLSEKLEHISYTNLHTTTIFAKDEIPYLRDSFGLLFPYNTEKALGVLNNTAIFSNRAKDNLNSYTFISKNSDSSYIDELVTTEKVMKTYWERALPVYNLERFKTINQLRANFYDIPNNLVLFGNYVDGISIREILGHSKNFSESL